MCFSATASFVAGTALSGIGATTIAKVKQRSELPFAMIPLLFGIQQLIEGVVWLTFSHDAPFLRQASTYSYSMFSHVLWPIYVPFAFRFVETTAWRRRAMLWFLGAGIVAGSYLFYQILTRPLVAAVEGHHLVYNAPHFHLLPVMTLYVIATCVSGFFSGHPFVRLFGALSLFSFIATYFLYEHALVSVWCFFAALLSVLIDLRLRYPTLGGYAPRLDLSMPQASA